MPVLLLEGQHVAWVDQAAPGVAHGGETVVNIKAVAAAQRYGLFKFDISTIPASVTIIDAVVRFYFTAVGPAAALLSVHKITGPAWNETVTWATIPAFDAAPKLSIAADGLPVINSWEDFTPDYVGYDADDGVGSPRWWMQRQVQRWYDATDANHGILLKADTGVGAVEWVAVGRTGTSHIVPILEVTYATQDTLPASAGGDRRAFVGEALAELNASVIKDVSFSVVLELAAGDLDVTGDFIAGPTLRRKLPFIDENLDLGNFDFQLSNKDGKYSPTNRDSDLWLHRAIGRDVVVKATVKDQTVTIYRGVITETPQYGDKRVEIMTAPKLRRELDYPLATALIDYTHDPWRRDTVTNLNPADAFYTLLHNYVGYADSGADNAFNMASFVDAKTEWAAQGLKVHLTWDGESAWEKLEELQHATLGALYQDFQGRFALHVWKPREPTAVELSGIENFRWSEDLSRIKNHIMVESRPWVRHMRGVTLYGGAGLFVYPLEYLEDVIPTERITISDPDSVNSWDVQHLDVIQSYVRTPEGVRLLARLYNQALSDPIYRGEASGNIGWMQHDLGDGVGLVRPDERIDDTAIVIQQDIDIKARSVDLQLIRSNWCLPRRDWVNVLSWYSGAISETFTGGLASPVPSSITGPTLLSGNTMDIVIGWTYEDTEIHHDGFAILINKGATDPGIPTLQSHTMMQILPRNARSSSMPKTFQADLHLSFAIAAFRGPAWNPGYGTFVTSAAAPDWQDVTLDGSIVAGSVPSNVPVFAAGAATLEKDGSTEYVLDWTYAQGAIEADGFDLIANFGDASPGLPALNNRDWSILLGPDARAFKMEGPKATMFASFGIAAYRRTEEGIAYTALVTHAGWTDLRANANIRMDPDELIPGAGTITKTQHLSAASLTRHSLTLGYGYAGGGTYVTPNFTHAVNSLVMYGVATIPIGCIITSFKARMYRTNAGDLALCELIKPNDAGGVAAVISLLTLIPQGAWTTVASGVLAETAAGLPYIVRVTLHSNAPGSIATDSRFMRCEIGYTMGDYDYAI